MSLAFPNGNEPLQEIHRPPWGAGWMKEDDVYEKMPLRHDDIVRFFFSGKLLAWREVPSGTVWLRPTEFRFEAGWKEMIEDTEWRKRTPGGST